MAPTTTTAAPILTYRHPDGLTARVWDRRFEGFAVTLTDDDAGEQLPTVRVYPDHRDAFRFARTLRGAR